MEDIYALLNINKGVLQDFHLQAEHAVDHQTELAISRSMRTLKEIEERMLTDSNVKVSQQTIDEIIMKVIDNADKNNKDMSIWSIRELRIVSYYLMKLQGNEGAYQYALTLLDSNWRDMFFNGLSFYCLDTWNMIDPELRTLTCQLLSKKLQAYKDNNKKYMAMKNHANLFDEAGPRRLSALLSQKKQNVTEAPTYFCNKPATLSQSYYSDVIVNFFEVNKITDLDYVDSILELHNNDRTKKLVFADLVMRVDNYGDELKRTQLCKFANRILGDITLTSTWAPFTGATESDAQKLKKAKQLVNLWFNRKIIETFFEVCVQDRDRKTFWLNYVDKVSAFKIVGSTATKRLLQGDSRVSGIFLRHFKETDSYTSQTAALVLFIRNKMIVEFSDTGALYVYNHNHNKVKLVTGPHKISNIADLKITSMGMLISISEWGYTTNYEEGRMTHQGHWQSRLNGWMQEMVLSVSNTSDSFFGTNENEVFKAKPVPKSEYTPLAKPKQKDLFDDVPEYLREKQSSTIVAKKTNTKDAVTYESNISWTIASKWVMHDKCRVVCNRKGYYLNVSRGRQYVHLRPLSGNTNATGSIWIKRPNANGWMQAVHSTSGREINIGYIKEAGGGLLYKQELSQTDSLRIKL